MPHQIRSSEFETGLYEIRYMNASTNARADRLPKIPRAKSVWTGELD